MVFAVNIGFTWALPDYEMSVSSKNVSTPSDDSYSYLNDVVVNNSTTLTPISYTNGTVAREISFDYGFSEATDIAITYQLKYTDGSTVNNVKLNVVDRDNYVLDAPTVNMQNGVTAYNQQASKGTLYYLGSLKGQGNQKIFSGVTFAENNNQVSNYKAVQAVNLYNKTYAVGDYLNNLQFQYTTLEIARYWQISEYSNGTTSVTVEEYNQLSASAQSSYGASKYKCIQAYTITNASNASVDSASLNSEVTTANYNAKISATSSLWTECYLCVSECTIGSTTYVVGQEISSSTYSGLSTADKGNFQHYYKCVTGHTVKGSNAKTISVNGTISQKEYSHLTAEEQAKFSPSSYTSFANKKLVIEVAVYTKLNVSATEYSAINYYDENHYFVNFKQQLVSRAYENWLLYKQNTDSTGAGKVTANKIMIYNAHGDFDNGLQYAYDFSSGQDITEIDNTPNITSQYIYSTATDSVGKFYAYAGGNRYDSGLGIYYMASSAGSIRFSIGYNWYSASGELLSSMPVTNVNIGANDLFNNYATGNFGLTKLVSANSCGYIDLLKYIEITTKGDIFNLVGCRLVITAVEAEITSSYSAWGASGNLTDDEVAVTSSTESSPALYKFAEMGTSTTLNTDLSITNNTDSAKTVTITVAPKFYAYNSQTGDNFAIASTKNLTFGDSSATGTRFNYKSTSWSKSGSSTSYTFTSSGIYLAPYTTVNVVESVLVASQTLNDWKITVGGVEYYSDYWFVLEVTNVTVSSATTNKTSTSSGELITELADGTINTGTTYISARNNTSQIMTNVVFSAKLNNMTNASNSVGYSLLDYSTNTTSTKSQSDTFTITFTGVNLLPGESIILAKITITSGSNVGLVSPSLTCALSSTPTYTTVYAKRDFASGNLSVINKTADLSTLSLTLKNYANTALSDITILNGGADKWSYSSSFKYIQKGTANSAYILSGQLLNILSGYYTQNIQTTIGV